MSLCKLIRSVIPLFRSLESIGFDFIYLKIVFILFKNPERLSQFPQTVDNKYSHSITTGFNINNNKKCFLSTKLLY